MKKSKSNPVTGLKRSADFSNHEKKSIVNEYKNGETVSNLARKYNISSEAIIYSWLSKFNVKTRNVYKRTANPVKNSGHPGKSEHQTHQPHIFNGKMPRIIKWYCGLGIFYYILNLMFMVWMAFFFLVMGG